MQANRRTWVIYSQHAAVDRQRLITQRFCIIIPPLGTIQFRKVIQALRRIRMIRPQHVAADQQRLFKQWLCIRIPPNVVINHAEIVQRGGIFIARFPIFSRNLFQDILI